MNKFVIFISLTLTSSILSAPNPLRFLPALKHEHIHDKFGQYALRYVTAEGTIVTENGKLVSNADGTGHVMVVDGEVTYVGDDGKTYVTKYTAGVDGVKMEGDHLPVPVTTTMAPVDSDAITTGATIVTSTLKVSLLNDSTVTTAVAPTTLVTSLPEAPVVPPLKTVAA